MIRTHGLTHISLAVADPDRALRFYRDVFGVEEYFRDDRSIQARRAGGFDIIAFELDERSAGTRGGISHFGYRLVEAADIDLAVEAVERAGGKILRRGEFSAGYPYAFVEDLDGYEIEIWYE